MARKILQVIFFIFGLLTIFFIVSTVLASRRIDYLVNNEEMLNNSDYDYLSMTLISFNNDNTKPFIVKEPLYQETFEEFDVDGKLTTKITLKIYATIEVKNGSFKDGFAILADDILVTDTFKQEDLHEMPVLEISLKLNKTPSLFDSKTFIDPLLVIPGSNKRVAFFHIESFKTSNSYAEIEQIVISYALKNEMPNKTLTILTNSDLENEIYEDEFDSIYNRDISCLLMENIVFDNKNDLENNDLLYHNPQHLKLFKQTNKLFILPILLDFIFLVAAYYLLFYHKYVIIKLKEKRKQKKENMLLLEEQFKNKKDGEN